MFTAQNTDERNKILDLRVIWRWMSAFGLSQRTSSFTWLWNHGCNNDQLQLMVWIMLCSDMWKRLFSFILVWFFSSLSHLCGTNGVSHTQSNLSGRHQKRTQHGSVQAFWTQQRNPRFRISRGIFHLLKKIFKWCSGRLNPCEAALLQPLLPDLTLRLLPGEGCCRKSSHCCLIGPHWQIRPLLPHLRLELLLQMIISHSPTLAVLNSNVLFMHTLLWFARTRHVVSVFI